MQGDERACRNLCRPGQARHQRVEDALWQARAGTHSCLESTLPADGSRLFADRVRCAVPLGSAGTTALHSRATFDTARALR